MNCQDMDKFIHVYLDREFAEGDRADFEAHLAECSQCRRMARFEQTFKQQLKTSLAHPRLGLDARERLRKKVLARLDEAPPEPAAASVRRWAVRLVPVAASVALLAVVWFQVRPKGALESRPAPRETPMALGADSAEIDPRAAQSFYAQLLSFPVVPPRFSDGQTRLVAARLARVEDERAAHLVYRQGDRDVSVILSARRPHLAGRLAPLRVGGKVVYVGRQGGRSVASFVHRGVAYTFSADLPISALTRMVRDVVGPGPGPLRLPGADAPVDAVPASAAGGP